MATLTTQETQSDDAYSGGDSSRGVRSGGVAELLRPQAERVASREGCTLVDVRHLHEDGGWVLRVVIDHPGGVQVEHCARVSRQLSALLDVEDLLPGAYRLEVSSPGLDRPLLVAADFRRYAGHRVRVLASQDDDGDRLHRGVLAGLQRGSILLDDDALGRLEIPLKRIAEARLEVEI